MTLPSVPDELKSGAVKILLDRLFPKWKRDRADLKRQIAAKVEASIADHTNEVIRWSQLQHALDIDPAASDLATIPLQFTTIPRRYGRSGVNDLWSEQELIDTDLHLAVLGDPGAGKTTTLRRIAGAITLDHDDDRFVVLIVCREQKWNDATNLFDHLATIFGVTSLLTEHDEKIAVIKAILNRGGVLVLDGLDEVPASQRANLERDLLLLARALKLGRIVMSCRSADFIPGIEGFNRAEILPLTDDQIRDVMIALLGLAAAADLYRDLIISRHPVADLANRPLFLLHLIALYRRRGAIPDRPVDIYQAIVSMMLTDWDELRRVVRSSSFYAKFPVEQKRRFLSDLALELFENDRRRFTGERLVDVYKRLAPKYELPSGEARLVAREIESHTGLIVESGSQYEFSHGSLQEYLAGEAASRKPDFDTARWVVRNPAVVAVAIALSSNANMLLHRMMIEPRGAPRPKDPYASLPSFLYRLGLERPLFEREEDLGRELLLLMFRAKLSDAWRIEPLMSIRAVRLSIADAIRHLYLVAAVGDTVLLRSRGDAPGFIPPLQYAHEVFEVISPHHR